MWSGLYGWWTSWTPQRDRGGIGHILALLTDLAKAIDPCGWDLIAFRTTVWSRDTSVGRENSSEWPTAVCYEHSCCQLFVPGLLRVGHPHPLFGLKGLSVSECVTVTSSGCARGWGGTHTLCCLFLGEEKPQMRSNLRELLLGTAGLISQKSARWASLSWVAWNSLKVSFSGKLHALLYCSG